MNLFRPEPGGALWLLRNELRLFWRKGDKKTSLRAVLSQSPSAGRILPLIFRPLSEVVPPPPLGSAPMEALALAATSVMIAFIATLIISQGLQRTIEAIYLRNDLDLLLSAPLKGWTILIVRSAGVAISTLPLYVFLLGPPILWLTLLNSPLWLTAIPTVLALAFGGTGVALLLVTVLFRLIGPKRTRIAAQILSLVIGAAIFILFQLPNFNRRFREIDEDEMLEGFEALQVDADAFYFFPRAPSQATPLQCCSSRSSAPVCSRSASGSFPAASSRTQPPSQPWSRAATRPRSHRAACAPACSPQSSARSCASSFATPSSSRVSACRSSTSSPSPIS